MGFVSTVPEMDGRRFFLLDTSLPGNSSAGHRYGLNLKPAEKNALIEFLKTF
jgi:hypothetical protein